MRVPIIIDSPQYPTRPPSETTYDEYQPSSQIPTFLSRLFPFSTYGNLTEANKTIEDLRRQLSFTRSLIESMREDRREEREFRRQEFEQFLNHHTPKIQKIIDESKADRKKFLNAMERIETHTEKLERPKTGSLLIIDDLDTPKEQSERILRRSEEIERTVQETLKSTENEAVLFIQRVWKGITATICCLGIYTILKDLICWSRRYFLKA